MKRILFTSLLPKELKRNEIFCVKDQVESLIDLGYEVDIAIASAHKESLKEVEKVLPSNAELLLFSAENPTTFIKLNPELAWQSRRFEIVPGKELLREKGNLYDGDLVFYTDSDQWTSKKSLKACLDNIFSNHLIDVIRMPVGFREPGGPDGCGPQRLSTQTYSFSLWFAKPILLGLVENMTTLSNIEKAKTGLGELYAPDNTFFHRLLSIGAVARNYDAAHTRHYVTDKEYWRVKNGQVDYIGGQPKKETTFLQSLTI
tara:strand:+ start:36 stop:812 length:777 start_codon:yes stop_codon:yes gene_type:complete